MQVSGAMDSKICLWDARGIHASGSLLLNVHCC